MSHLVLGNRVMTVGSPAWHRLDQNYPVDSTFTARQALDVIDGVNGKIIFDKLPIAVNVPGYGWVESEDTYQLVRRPIKEDPMPRFFGEVKAHYSVLQNDDIADIVDIVLSGTDWKLSTAGILDNGSKIFFCLKGPDVAICGDDIGMYFGITEQRTGKSAVDFAATLTRYVCWNTVSYGLANSKARITIRHHQDVLSETQWRMEVIRDLINSGNSLVDSLKTLDQIVVTQERMIAILDELFPAPKKPRTLELKTSNRAELLERAETAEYAYAWQVQRQARFREETLENFRYNRGEDRQGNGWHAYNAITGLIDHQMGKDTEFGSVASAKRSLSPQMDELRAKALTLIKGKE